jgi:hypothetical protein
VSHVLCGIGVGVAAGDHAVDVAGDFIGLRGGNARREGVPTFDTSNPETGVIQPTTLRFTQQES